MEENLPTKSLEDRIIDLVADKPSFTFKSIREVFSQDTDRAIYRALNALEDQSKVKFLTWHGRSKVYTCSGVSKLPILRNALGQTGTLADFFLSTPNMYKDGNWEQLKDINKLPLDFASLFLAANDEDGKQDYHELMRRLNNHKSKLLLLLGYVDSVLNHPTMRGDFDYFREILTGKDAPTPQLLTEYKRWLTSNKEQLDA